MKRGPSAGGRMLTLGGIGAPAAVVLCLRLLAGLEPASAPAALAPGLDTALLAPVSAEPKLTAAEQRAAEWIARLTPFGGFESPMNHPRPTAPVPVAEPPSETGPVPEAPAAPVLAAAPTMSLSGVLASSAGELAVINGSVFRVGQSVSPGWTIDTIDVKRKQVRIVGADGRVIYLETPR